jgi:gamma-glutamylcyclotransferase (GGCT)/AIG2-like uncharacterized protein YtfP
MTEALFVYGSLRSPCDNPHARFLRDKAELLGHATVRGSIFRIGTYPGYRAEPDGIVRGELWRLPDPAPVLAALDLYEGPEYSRVETTLETPRARAWIYLYIGPVPTGQRIESGDFLAP